jgi:hypothetical protein
MTRRLVAMAAVTLAAVAVPSGPASAAPTTTTTHEHGVVETFVDVVPTCEGGGPEYTITTTANTHEHVTAFADGRVHEVFGATGRFTAVPLEDQSLPSYTGRFSTSGSFHENRRSAGGTFTFNVHGTGSDGSTFKNHNVDHFNQRPNGTVHQFFKCH